MTTTKFEVSLPRKLARRFRVERVVGQGGFGVVLRAIQVGLDRAVALKLLLPEHTADPATRARLIKESRLVARLSNPCIVPVLDHGIEEDMAYIVFPFVEGASLRSQIETGGLSWAQVLGHALRIAEALAAIHEAGVVHRDLKPENVLLNEAGESFVTDFGVSKPLGTMVKTASGQILGTPGYLAPELVRGGEPAPGSDLYALGVMLWEMLSGFRPHQRGDPLDPGSTRPPLTALTRSVEADPPALPLSVSIPGPFEELIGRLVSRDPAARPRSTLEVLTLLQDLRARISDGQIGLATTARSSSPLVRGDAQQPTRLVLSQLDRSRREPPGFEPTLAIAGQTGAFRVLRILTGVGLALAVTVGLTSMAFRTVDQPAAVAAPVTATASTASPPGAPPSRR
ncbi:MAG: serine/threonine protein kinase [Candidatus Riflebacteria bacterium]|nr:serine/threonine protein kinase [Candidatus Riflebacteria bacterium]